MNEPDLRSNNIGDVLLPAGSTHGFMAAQKMPSKLWMWHRCSKVFLICTSNDPCMAKEGLDFLLLFCPLTICSHQRYPRWISLPFAGCSTFLGSGLSWIFSYHSWHFQSSAWPRIFYCVNVHLLYTYATVLKLNLAPKNFVPYTGLRIWLVTLILRQRISVW